jgi:hypothetical protein
MQAVLGHARVHRLVVRLGRAVVHGLEPVAQHDANRLRCLVEDAIVVPSATAQPMPRRIERHGRQQERADLVGPDSWQITGRFQHSVRAMRSERCFLPNLQKLHGGLGRRSTMRLGSMGQARQGNPRTPLTELSQRARRIDLATHGGVTADDLGVGEGRPAKQGSTDGGAGPVDLVLGKRGTSFLDTVAQLDLGGRRRTPLGGEGHWDLLMPD